METHAERFRRILMDGPLLRSFRLIKPNIWPASRPHIYVSAGGNIVTDPHVILKSRRRNHFEASARESCIFPATYREATHLHRCNRLRGRNRRAAEPHFFCVTTRTGGNISSLDKSHNEGFLLFSATHCAKSQPYCYTALLL